jgi:hypothetical protein
VPKEYRSCPVWGLQVAVCRLFRPDLQISYHPSKPGRYVALLLPLPQVLQKRAVNAAPEVLLELHDSDAAVGAVICERDEAAALALFDGHLGYYRDACTRRHHGQNRSELAALKDHVGLQAGPSAGGESIFAEAVAFLEQEKRIVLDLFQVNSGQ